MLIERLLAVRPYGIQTVIALPLNSFMQSYRHRFRHPSLDHQRNRRRRCRRGY